MTVLPPAGYDATLQEKLVRWSILIALSNVAIGIGHCVTSPLYSHRHHFHRHCNFISNKISIPSTRILILLAPRIGMILGISTILISVVISPFSNDVYEDVLCPCHWNKNQYTTMSILVAYKPMKYVIWFGFSGVAFLTIITAFVGIRRWWNDATFLQKRKKIRKIGLSIWIALMITLGFSISGTLIFSRQFDRSLHILFAYSYFTSSVFGTVFGHLIIRWDAISRHEASLPVSDIGRRWSLVAMSICVFLSLWYIDVYSLRIVTPMIFPTQSEGILALSEYLVMISQLVWFGSLSLVFLAAVDNNENISISQPLAGNEIQSLNSVCIQAA